MCSSRFNRKETNCGQSRIVFFGGNPKAVLWLFCEDFLVENRTGETVELTPGGHSLWNRTSDRQHVRTRCCRNISKCDDETFLRTENWRESYLASWSRLRRVSPALSSRSAVLFHLNSSSSRSAAQLPRWIYRRPTATIRTWWNITLVRVSADHKSVCSAPKRSVSIRKERLAVFQQ